MKSSPKCLRSLLLLVALGTWSLCLERPSDASEKPRTTWLATEVKALQAEDSGVLSDDQAERFPATIFAQAAAAGLQITSTSRVTSSTNAFFYERRQSLALQATERQFLDFLQNVGTSNSVLRVRALSSRPNPERTRFLASVTVAGSYRLSSNGRPQALESSEVEYRVLNERRALRRAALDCYTVTKETLPASWTLDALNFEGGKRLSLHGQAPADQARVLEDLRAQLQKAKGRDGEALFSPSGGEATMRMANTGMSNFSWSMQLNLSPAESP
jgi:hypothetical protein